MSIDFPPAVGPLSGKAMPVFWNSPVTAAIDPTLRVDASSSVMLSGILETISLSTRVYCWNVPQSAGLYKPWKKLHVVDKMTAAEVNMADVHFIALLQVSHLRTQGLNDTSAV